MPDKMIRCPEGHFYDPSKHNACPWCALPSDSASAEKTRPAQAATPPPLPGGPPPIPAAPTPAAAPPAGLSPSVTRRFGLDAAGGVGTDPVVGWLVCLEGHDRGRDYRLHMEKNFIGRSPLMDVCIQNDDTVSREKHALLIFDPKKQVFWVLPGDASGLVYLNGDIVHSPTQMHAHDVIELGRTKLVLIPFCGDKYSWTAEAPVAPQASA
jgi:hypothetical protein